MSIVYPEKNICIIIISYNAEKTIELLINDIPKDFVDSIIVGDDASTDNTLEILGKFKDIKINKSKTNKGMGGNLKACFDIALENNPDIIIQLHGDNQYDAKKIPNIIKKILSDDCDLILGSRILGGESLSGGMPKYKYLGNHLLNFIQNLFYGLNLSDYATGYKAYKAKSLRLLPYKRNRDDFIFDEQINTQFVFFGFKISQIGIPTRYFKEASSVGLKTSIHYGIWTLITLFQFLSARMKIFNPKFLS